MSVRKRLVSCELGIQQMRFGIRVFGKFSFKGLIANNRDQRSPTVRVAIPGAVTAPMPPTPIGARSCSVCKESSGNSVAACSH